MCLLEKWKTGVARIQKKKHYLPTWFYSPPVILSQNLLALMLNLLVCQNYPISP
jgi:hypothetical protein